MPSIREADKKLASLPFYRPTWVEIDHARLKSNYEQIARIAAPRSILCVVKANAYGHGLVNVSKTLAKCGAKFFGITSLEEALTLKKAGSKVPALILGNIFPFENLETAIRNKVRITLASVEAARMCDHYARKMGKKVYAHAKIDSGMGRIGVNVANGLKFIQEIRQFKTIILEGLYTHFSDSSEDVPFTQLQLEQFSKLVASLKSHGIEIPYVHCDNSGAILKYPEPHFTLVRPGLSLYGISPVKQDRAQLQPILTWKSRIVYLKGVPPNTPISYARTFITHRKSKIATAAFGYADGFRRSFSNKAQVLVNGKRVPVLGRVTMDMTMLDVTDLPGVRVGDEVVIIGTQDGQTISVWELADWAGTSPYEILCGITARVPRVDR